MAISSSVWLEPVPGAETPDALRASLGTDALWLDTPEAGVLAAHLRDRLHLDARPVGRRVLVVCTDPASVLAQVYGVEGVDGAAVRRPTLDDVFASVTGGAALSPALP